MDEHELPGSGPLPENAGASPDPEWDEYVAWREREIAAGHDEEPPAPWEIEGPAVSLSLGDAADIDPALLAAICGPDGLGGEALGPQFGQDAAADALRPGPVLAALTEQAADDPSGLTDDQLIGALHAARRLENRAHYLQTRTIAEFARRRTEQYEAAQARGVPAGRRAGEFPSSELAAELLISRVAAGQRIDAATSLTTRLPGTLQGMSAGLIDAERAATIAAYTACLSREDAARADEILAQAAPQVRAQTLVRRAAALVMKLDPQAAKQRKERAKRIAQRVEVQLEPSGNASVAGRELDVADALASKASIHSLALRLRRAGLAGTLDHLRVMVFNDLLQGRSPLDRLSPVPEAPSDAQAPAADDRAPDASQVPPDDADDQVRADDEVPADDRDWRDVPVAEEPADDREAADDHSADEDGPEDGHGHGGDAIGSWPGPCGDPDPAQDYGYDDDRTAAPVPAGTGVQARRPAVTPMPAVINLLVPAGTLFGWDTTPSRASGWGLLDPGETRDIVHAASLHPRTRWCMTATGPDGTAIAHGCSEGQYPWTPAVPPDPPSSAPPDQRAPPDRSQAEQFAALLRGLNITLEPIAKGTCDHRHAEDRYTPSRRLQHLVRARNDTCTAPGCQAQAIHADLDHTTPYPEGITDECNLGPKCRSHHRAKQAPGWKVEQPEPGVFRWTLPSGRTHATRPTPY